MARPQCDIWRWVRVRRSIGTTFALLNFEGVRYGNLIPQVTKLGNEEYVIIIFL